MVKSGELPECWVMFANSGSDRSEYNETPRHDQQSSKHGLREVIEKPPHSQIRAGQPKRIDTLKQVHRSQMDLFGEILKRLLKHKWLVKPEMLRRNPQLLIVWKGYTE